MSLSRVSGAKSLFTAQSWCKGYVLNEYQGDGVGGMEVSDINGGCVTDLGLLSWETILPVWLSLRPENPYWNPLTGNSECIHMCVCVSAMVSCGLG